MIISETGMAGVPKSLQKQGWTAKAKLQRVSVIRSPEHILEHIRHVS
jgi:hypothetical protein